MKLVLQVAVVVSSLVFAAVVLAQGGPGSGVRDCHATQTGCASGCPSNEICCCCSTAGIYRCQVLPEGYLNCANWGNPNCLPE